MPDPAVEGPAAPFASLTDFDETVVTGGGSKILMHSPGGRLLPSSDDDESTNSSRHRLGGGGDGGGDDMHDYQHEPYRTDATPENMFAGISSSSPRGSACERFENDHRPPPDLQQRRRLPSKPVILLTLLTSLGGVLFGYDLGVIASALPGIADEFHLNDASQEWIVSALYVGGGIGAGIGGALCDAYGRRQSILWVDVAFVAGAAVLASAAGPVQLVVGRVVVGFAVALSGLADVAYLSEISPAEFRGALVSVNEACISLGFLLSFVAGTVLGPDAWRTLFGLSGLLALLQFVGMWMYMPESPVWLEKQGRFEESDVARRHIQQSRPAKMPRADSRRASSTVLVQESTVPSVPLYHTVGSSDPNAQHEPPCHEGTAVTTSPSCALRTGHPLRDLGRQLVEFCRIASTRYTRQSVVALFLASMQQFCGQTNVLSYANHLLHNNNNNDGGGDGSESSSSRWAALWIGIVKFIVTCVVILKIESSGRRFFLLSGMCTIAVGLALLVVAFSSGDALDSSSALVLPGMLLMVCGYSMSFGPLTWLLTSELYPAEIRGRALGCGTIVTYLCAALVTATFLSAQSVMGTSLVFGGYLVLTLLGLAFALVAIPETREKTPEQIELVMQQMSWWSNVAREDRGLSFRFDDERGWDGGGGVDDGVDDSALRGPPATELRQMT